MTSVAGQRLETDVAVIGSGFGGSLTAMALARLGHSVVMIERDRHPRFAIGESTTPLTNLLVEEIADRFDLPGLRPLSKWGTWQRTYPQVACGLKRGFTFYRHDPGARFDDDASHGRQLLVAASPHDDVADTHWYRPDVDRLLVDLATAEGVQYLDETNLDAVRFSDDSQVLEGRRHIAAVRVTCRFVVDASGPRGFLHRALGLREAPLSWLPRTQALFAHFTGVGRWDHLIPHDGVPPYPVDDAAVHHVFPGGWMWVLRFGNGITSAGVAVTDAFASEIGLAGGAAAWTRVLDAFPSVRDQFADASAITPFAYSPRLAWRTPRVTGPGWALLPSAAGVIDPLLSTGFPLTLLGIGRLVDAVHAQLTVGDVGGALGEYERRTLRELDATERLVAALYTCMSDFTLFKKLSLLYFAAASFSETVRRLGRHDRASSFLLCDDPAFGPALEECAARAADQPRGPEREALLARIDDVIGPFDVAGLSDAARRDWYPVRVQDLFDARDRLGATTADIEALIARCGLGTAQPAAVLQGAGDR